MGQELAGDGRTLSPGAACALLAADLVWRPLGRSTSASPAGITAVHVPLDLPGITIGNVLVSPDGRTLAISGAREDGRTSLWTQRLADGRATEIPNLDADARLFGWSRDGTELAVRTSRGIVAIRLDGFNRPAARTRGAGGDHQHVGEGDVLFGTEQGIRAISLGTGAARDLVKGMALRPRFLPDGRRFTYTSRAEGAQGNPDGLYVSSVDAPATRRMILPKRLSGAYADGYLFFVEDGTLFGQPFDVSRAELSGSPVPVLDGVRYFHPNGDATFDVGGGTIVYGTRPPDDSPIWVDRRGAVTGKLGAAGLYQEPRISPDGRRVVYSRFDRRRGTGDLWLQDLARHTTVRLTNDEWSEARIEWSRDGKTIAYRSDRDGPPDVLVQDVDAGTPPRTLYATPGVDDPVSWLPGDRLLVQTSTQFRVIKSDGTIDDTITGDCEYPEWRRHGVVRRPVAGVDRAREREIRGVRSAVRSPGTGRSSVGRRRRETRVVGRWPLVVFQVGADGDAGSRSCQRPGFRQRSADGRLLLRPRYQ